MADIARQLDSYGRQSQQTGAKLQGLRDEEQGLRQALAAAKAQKAGAQQEVGGLHLKLRALEQEVKQQQLAVNKLQDSNDTIRASIKAARTQQQAMAQQRCSEQEAFLVAAKQLDQEVDVLLAAAATLKPGSTTGAEGGASQSALAMAADMPFGQDVRGTAGHSTLLEGAEEEAQVLLVGAGGSLQSQQQLLSLGGLASPGATPAAGSPAEQLLLPEDLEVEGAALERGVGPQGAGQGMQLAAGGAEEAEEDAPQLVGGSEAQEVGVGGSKALQLAGAAGEGEEDDVSRGSDQ